MVAADRSVQCAEQAAGEKREDAVDPGKEFGGFLRIADDDADVLVAVFADLLVLRETVGVDRTAGDDVCADESAEDRAAGGGNGPQPDASHAFAPALDRSSDQPLPAPPPPPP